MRTLFLLTAVFVFSVSALAGPNGGGTLIIDDAHMTIQFTTGVPWCQQGTELDACENADTEIHASSGDPAFFKVYAAFWPGNAPRLMGLTWGVTYDPDLIVLDPSWSQMCGDFQLNDDGWPGPGTGSTVTWGTPQTTSLVEVYTFTGYSLGAGVLQLGPNPTQGGYFGDDSVPAILDPIAGYGSLGFDMPGSVVCPVAPPPIGACCDPYTGDCTITPQDQCLPPNTFDPDWTSCDPNPCPPIYPPTLGACCDLCAGECTITTHSECEGEDFVFFGDIWCLPNPCPASAGACCTPVTGECTIVPCPSACPPPRVFHPEWTACEPNPCEPTPAQPQTWGRIKAVYR